MSHFRIILIIAVLTALMIAAITVRIENVSRFYKLRASMVQLSQIKQSLYHKNIILEKLTSTESIINHTGLDSSSTNLDK